MGYYKFYFLWYAIVLCVFSKEVKSANESIQWGNDCPRVCNCKNTDFKDLPIVKWMYNEVKSEVEPNSTQNEVLEENETEPLNGHHTQIFKTAFCMFMNVTKPKDFLNILPSDTEALILFQTIDSDDITIEDDIKLPKLILFEIHGNNPSRIYITDRMFKSIKSAKYINIQSVSLNKLTLETNEPAPIVESKIYKKENSYESNKIVPVLPTYLHKENNNRKNRLIFLQPKDIDMVPYETFKKTKKRTKANNLFLYNKDLIFLRITNCGLKDISYDLFDGLDFLETLILDNNAIEYIPDFSFYGAPMLKTLSLANNKIAQLQVTDLGGLLDLKYLNLKNNNITTLSETTFPPLPKLIVADLSNNPIEVVYPHTFEVLNATKELTLGSNDVQLRLHQNSFVGLESLEVLNLLSINVSTLEQNLLTGLPKLIELDIKGTIKYIAFDAFVEMPEMKRLTLSNCSIQSVSMDAFYGIYNLEYLDLSHNQLQELPSGLFNKQYSLRELILNNNQLASLPEGIFKSIPNILVVRLDMNPLHCSCHMKYWDISLMTKSTEKTKKISCQWDHLKKGYNCPLKSTTKLIYNKKVEPICSSPEKFKGMTISYVIRKYLNCNGQFYSTNNDLYAKKKFREFKQHKLINELDVRYNTSINNSTELSLQSNNSHFETIFSNTTLNNTASIANNINVTAGMIDKNSELNIKEIPSSTSERRVLLNNGTYINKSLFKEEISKMTKKNKAKSYFSKLQNKLNDQ